MKKSYPTYGIPDVLAQYRTVANANSSNKLRAAKKNWELYRHIEGHNIVRASWYFANYAVNSVLQVIKFKFVK